MSPADALQDALYAQRYRDLLRMLRIACANVDWLAHQHLIRNGWVSVLRSNTDRVGVLVRKIEENT